MTSPGISTGQLETDPFAPSGELVRQQLQRILAGPAFRNSKRYAAVLRYIVEQTLEGKSDQLKERTIGVDVFDREPDYDTASDHVVRSAMAEVRKRLAQHYAESSQPNELHLELQPGSYVPQFRGMLRIAPTTPIAVEPGPPGRSRSYAISLRSLAAALVGLLLFALIFLLRDSAFSNDPLGEFWHPVLSSSGETLLCIGNLEGGKTPTAKETPLDVRGMDLGEFHRLPTQTINLADAIALARFAGFLQARGKQWRVAAQSDATFGDLRNGPAVLIGLMNNDWTERSVGKLRYRAEKIAPRTVVIRDTRYPEKNDWRLDYSTPVSKVTKDYALVLRFFDPNTGQPVITAAGISLFGTLAAAEFLTDPGEMKKLGSLAPGWEKKNLEIVLSTEVVRAKSGKPHIIATYVW